MSQYIDLDKQWGALAESIYDILDMQPDNYLANQILGVIEDISEPHEYIELPCNVGDTIYEIVDRRRDGKWVPVVVERVVESFEIGKTGIWGRCGTTILISFSNGRVFLDKKEAEKKAEEMRRGDAK